ncbi:MAG: phosphoribosyltransferase [Gemmatimonadaceae bacterium]
MKSRDWPRTGSPGTHRRRRDPSPMYFQDRMDAGRQLAREILARHPDIRAHDPIVLGIPRGGVMVACQVAHALNAPLDVIVARKLGAPRQEELGIGAVTPDGTRVLDEDIIAALGVPDEYLDDVTEREVNEAQRRMRVFRGSRPPPVVEHRVVVLVDDGLATGVTARAALATLRHERPNLLIFGAPVCSREGRILIGHDADDVVCVALPPDFRGVGEWYTEFEQTTDAEVIAALRASA